MKTSKTFKGFTSSQLADRAGYKIVPNRFVTLQMPDAKIFMIKSSRDELIIANEDYTKVVARLEYL